MYDRHLHHVMCVILLYYISTGFLVNSISDYEVRGDEDLAWAAVAERQNQGEYGEDQSQQDTTVSGVQRDWSAYCGRM